MAASEPAHVLGRPSARPERALDRRIPWILFAAGALLRVLVAFLRGTPLFSDETQYLSIARDVLATGTHTLHFYYPSGYGYFAALILGITGDGTRAVLVAQAILSAAIGPLIYALAGRCGFGRPASIGAAVLYLVLIQPLLTVGMLLSDTFFTTITLAALFLLIRDEGGRLPAHLAAGFLLGWAWTARSVGLVGVLVAGAWIIARPIAPRRRVALVLCVGAALALPVGYVLARNWSAHHVFALEANAGINIYQGNNPDTDLLHTGSQPVPPLPGETPAQTQARAGREGIDYILSHPHIFAARWLYRFSQIVGPSPGREAIFAFRDRFGLRPIVGVHMIEALVLWSVTLGGLALRGRRNRVFLFCALYAAAYCALVAAVIAAPRYRLPAIPFACVLFAGGLQSLIDLRGAGRRVARDRRVWIAGLVTLVLIANMGWHVVREMPKASNPVYRSQWR